LKQQSKGKIRMSIRKLNDYIDKLFQYDDEDKRLNESENQPQGQPQGEVFDIASFYPFGYPEKVGKEEEEEEEEVYTPETAAKEIDDILDEIDNKDEEFDENEEDDVESKNEEKGNRGKEGKDEGEDEEDESCCDDKQSLGWEYGGEVEQDWLGSETDVPEEEEVEVYGYVVPKQTVEDIEKLEKYLRFVGVLNEDENISKVWDVFEVFTPEEYYLPEGFVVIGVRADAIDGDKLVLGEGLFDSKIVRGGKVILGAKKARLRLQRRRYYRKMKARLRMRQRRAALRRKARGGRVSAKEYKRIVSMRRSGTLRRKRFAIESGRRGFHRLGESEQVPLFESIATYFPETRDLLSYRYILTSVLDQIEDLMDGYNFGILGESVSRNELKAKLLRRIELFEDFVNSLTTKLAKRILNKVKLEEQSMDMMDELKELQDEYNEFIDYLQEYLVELRNAIQEGDFDEADEILVDLQLAIDDFFGYIYPELAEEEEEAEEDYGAEESEPVSDVEEKEGDDYIIPILSDEDDEGEGEEEPEENEEKVLRKKK
jgi:hypothetical protein